MLAVHFSGGQSLNAPNPPRFVDVSPPPPPKAKILYEILEISNYSFVSLQVKEIEERDRRSCEAKLQEIRQTTARTNYLQCLHQMVNSKTTASHDGSCELSDGSCDFTANGSNDIPLESPGTALVDGQHALKLKGHAPSPNQPKASPRANEKTRNDHKIPKKEPRRTATTIPSKFVPKTKLILHTEYKSTSTKTVSPRVARVSPKKGVSTMGVSPRDVYWAKEPEKGTKSGRLRPSSSRLPSGRVPSGKVL